MFVSSFTEEHRPLRHELFELGQTLGRYVWVCEHPACRPDLYGKNPLEVCDELIRHVREAQIYVAILGGSRRGSREHGTVIEVDESPSAVSHFEIELFQAALLGKDVELFIAKGFSPGPRLLALLEIVEHAMPERAWRAPMSDAEIAREVKRLLLAPPRIPWLTSRRYQFRKQLVTRFYHRRGRAGHGSLLFLGGEYVRRGEVNESVVRSLFAQVEGSKNQEHKLARLWLVMRELMAAPPEDEKFATFRPLWNQALGRWGSAAAWYGLHAHLNLGGLAALQSMARVRLLLRENPPRDADSSNFRHPAVALASAVYSIAKLAPHPSDRRALFDEALNHLREVGDDTARSRSNALAMRGSIFLQLSNVSEAVAAYEEALHLRETAGESAGRIGESMSELGFAYLRQGRVWKGCDFMRAGVEKLSGDESGFLIRAHKKLAWGYALTGHPLKAWGERDKAKQLAHKNRMFDQL